MLSSGWGPTPQSKAVLKEDTFRGDDANDDRTKFDRLISDALDLEYDNFLCNFDFIQSTLRFAEDPSPKPDEWTEPPEFQGQLDYLNTNLKKGRLDRFINSDFSTAPKPFSDEFQQLSKRDMEFYTKIAVVLREIIRDGWKNKKGRRKDPYLYWPYRLSRGDSDLYNGVDCAGPRPISAFDLESFIDYLETVTWHPTAYGNIFGSAVGVGLVRQRLQGNLVVEETSLEPFPFVAQPFDSSRTFSEVIAGFNGLKAVNFFKSIASDYKGIKTGIRFPLSTEFDEAFFNRLVVGSSASKAIAQRWYPKGSFSFGEVAIRISGNFSDGLDNGETYKCFLDGIFCVGWGFNPITPPSPPAGPDDAPSSAPSSEPSTAPSQPPSSYPSSTPSQAPSSAPSTTPN